ncbi:MAG: polysaccharide biosynthesis protein [Phycisphaerales bacterium]|jgi:FlaA1/EpsC-like NDP-sugar epimerase|nr:polysaccharide biosynthesis protein [Phycisphaerales bacterium]
MPKSTDNENTSLPVGDVPESPEELWSWWDDLYTRYRPAWIGLVHVVLFSIALAIAFLIRFDTSTGDWSQIGDWSERYILALPFFIVIKLLIFGRMRLLRGGWKFSGIRDVVQIFFACWWFTLVTLILIYVFSTIPPKLDRAPIPMLGAYFNRSVFPHGVLAMDFFSTMFLVGICRMGYRVYHEEFRPISNEGRQRVLIVGAGSAGENVIREIRRMREDRYDVVGLVDDDPTKKKIQIHGVPVLGTTDEILEVCKDNDIEEIIIAIPSASRKDITRVIDFCTGTKLKFQSLPSLGDMIDGKVTVSQIRPVDISDLLGRDEVELDTSAISGFVASRCVLVTGAGGSIGSEMCRQMAEYGPSELILLEQAETPLFDIENELKKAFPDLRISPCVCDIYDRDRVMAVWSNFHPDVVIHAAAHKHVPLMEINPSEAVKNNVLGSKNVADASHQTGVAEFVMISTDKAVNPSSVMGCTKRIAEIYTQSLNGAEGAKTQFKAVRFGNVLGSNGSVIPTFRKQIAAGGPVTVTHREMTRYFMTIPEAAQLVLQAAATGKGGQIFLLDMGEPVRISDLAEQMITLSGLIPGEDIDIKYTGCRPGEKLFEELKIEGEDIDPTVHSKVMVWKHGIRDLDQIRKQVAQLQTLENSLDRDAIVLQLQRVVPEYTPLNPPKMRRPNTEA